MLTPVRTTAPALSPVSLAEVRAHLRIDHTDEDPTLQLYIDAATGYFEGCTGILTRALVTQSWQQFYPVFTDPIILPLGLQPVRSVTSINYYDAGNVSRLLSDTLYRLVHAELGPRIARTTSDAWPATVARDDAVTVEFVAGDAPAAVPAPIRQAMLLLVGHWYAQREAVAAGTYAEVPYAVHALLIGHARIGM
ncbi:MAG TPA: head-tail connector protein [Xanthobacteraceae bacterium]|nr:head-tail connector protein [Xanthobacteraceae bacterium]